jgi:hypothetical protein
VSPFCFNTDSLRFSDQKLFRNRESKVIQDEHERVKMNTYKVLRFPRIGLLIVMLVLLAASFLAVSIPLAWSLIGTQLSPSPIHADPSAVVNTFHSAINSNDKAALLALFADDATVTDNGAIMEGSEEIRNWVFYSQRMAGLRLTAVYTETEGEKVIWLDTAYNGPEGNSRYYLLRWEALTRNGKIQSLTVMPHFRSDRK